MWPKSAYPHSFSGWLSPFSDAKEENAGGLTLPEKSQESRKTK